MVHISEKTRDLAGFGALLVFVGAFLLFPQEIPKEIQGDFPADAYPKALLLFALALLGIQTVCTLLQGKGERLTLSGDQAIRIGALVIIMWGGYLIILSAGFLLAGAYFVLGYAWLLQERNHAALMVALGTPTLVYLCLEHAFRIRLPSILDIL
jgi:hypothetical protein